MNIAYLALTGRASDLANRLWEQTGGKLYTKQTMGTRPFAQWVSEAWKSCDALVFIMASGIAVRSVAPLLESKVCDPAVIVMDGRGQFVISLLSGHIGGANELAVKLAEISGGQAVLTTGTDVEQTLAFDVFAKEHGCVIENIGELKYISGAMIEKEPVDVYCCSEKDFTFPENVRVFGLSEGHAANMADSRHITADTAVVIAHPFSHPDLSAKYAHVLYLRPKNLYIGIGCKKNTAPEAMAQAFLDFLKHLSLSPKSIAGMGTIDLKAGEPAILQLSEHFGLPLTIVERQTLEALENAGRVNVSAFVKETTGVGSVCEGCALALAEAGGGRARLVCEKTKYPGMTFALAEGRFPAMRLAES